MSRDKKSDNAYHVFLRQPSQNIIIYTYNNVSLAFMALM